MWDQTGKKQDKMDLKVSGNRKYGEKELVKK